MSHKAINSDRPNRDISQFRPPRITGLFVAAKGCFFVLIRILYAAVLTNKTGGFTVKLRWFVIVLILLIRPALFGQDPGNAPYMDSDLSPERRAADLVSRMTLEEKVLQMQSTALAIPRLSVPAYNW